MDRNERTALAAALVAILALAARLRALAAMAAMLGLLVLVGGRRPPAARRGRRRRRDPWEEAFADDAAVVVERESMPADTTTTTTAPADAAATEEDQPAPDPTPGFVSEQDYANGLLYGEHSTGRPIHRLSGRPPPTAPPCESGGPGLEAVGMARRLHRIVPPRLGSSRRLRAGVQRHSLS